MLQQMAAVAELEAGMIADRTRKALKAKAAWYAGLDDTGRDALRTAGKATQLGGDRGARLSDAQRARGRAEISARASARAADFAPVLAEIRAAGASSLASIAAELNDRNIPASRGGKSSPVQVARVLKEIAA